MLENTPFTSLFIPCLYLLTFSFSFGVGSGDSCDRHRLSGKKCQGQHLSKQLRTSLSQAQRLNDWRFIVNTCWDLCGDNCQVRKWLLQQSQLAITEVEDSQVRGITFLDRGRPQKNRSASTSTLLSLITPHSHSEDGYKSDGLTDKRTDRAS